MLSDVYFPRVNGVSTSIRTFACALLRLGHRVTLVAPGYGDVEGVPDDAGLEVIRLPSRVVFFDPEDRLIRARAMRQAIDRLAVRPWDVIHVHTPFRAHTLGVRLARRTGRPLVETYHTYFEEYVGHYLPWLPSGVTRRIARATSRRLCHQVDHLIVPSVQMVEVLDRYGIQTPHSVIPTGLELAEFSGGDGARFRRRHGIDPGRPTLVTVSRLAVEKNIGFLLEVVARLVGAFPTLLFLVAGEGPDAPRLRARVEQLGLGANVRFFGNLDRECELLDAYRAGDAFVFASPTETQGLVLLEAMALGVPIVSTAVMGTATVLAGAGSAVVSDEEVGAFADNVARVLRSAELRGALSDAGPRDARRWGTDVLMGQVVDLYRGLGEAADVGTLQPAQSS